jgi:hypothetical protein
MQAACADPVGALLVFLDLLEGQAERLAELLLAHADQHAAHAHPATHMPIDGVRRLLGHGRVFVAPFWPAGIHSSFLRLS